MRCSIVVFAFALLAAAESRAQSQPLAPGNHTLTISHGGRSRSYIVHVPKAATQQKPLPLLFAFHGGGGEARTYQAYAGLDSVAGREGFVVLYPNGTSGIGRLLTFNGGECCGYAMNQRVDDVGAAIAMLDDVARRTSIDANRVYSTGHSNGAIMTYRLAAERADRIVAIAPVAGAYGMAQFAPSRPVAVLHIHSVDDPRALYAGGVGPPFPGTNSRSTHRPAMEGVNRWVTNNKCRGEPRTAETRTGRAGTRDSGQTATMLVWDGCAPGGNLAHWKLTGSGHGWPGRVQSALREELIGPPTTLISAAEEIWKFVSAVRR